VSPYSRPHKPLDGSPQTGYTGSGVVTADAAGATDAAAWLHGDDSEEAAELQRLTALSRHRMLSPVDRYLRYKVVTRAERATLVGCWVVWAVLVAHTALKVASDYYHGFDGEGHVPAPVQTHWLHFAGVVTVGRSSGFARALVHNAGSAFLLALMMLLQRRAGAGMDAVAQAWVEFRLLRQHTYEWVPKVETAEVADWGEFLKAQRARYTPRWPTLLLAALTLTRVIMPLLPESTRWSSADITGARDALSQILVVFGIV